MSPGSIHTIIDLGCGTGRFTNALCDRFSAKVYGIDPSRKMLAMARQATSSPLIEWVRGSAEVIPLADGVADLVFLSMVYHHIQDKCQAIAEFARVLKRGGSLCIRTSTTDELDSYPWLRFFPGARQIELSRAPSRKGLTQTVQAAGFELSEHLVLHQLFAQDSCQYLAKISLRGLSSLKAIPDEEFRHGLVRLAEYCRERESNGAIFEDIDLFVFERTDQGRRAKDETFPCRR